MEHLPMCYAGFFGNGGLWMAGWEESSGARQKKTLSFAGEAAQIL
jgi:hypothetical protein